MTQPPIRPDGATEMVRRTVPPGRRMRRTAAPWLLLSPALVLLAVLLLWPLIRVLNLSLQDYELRNLLQRSEEHTSELQSRGHLVCRLLLEKQNTKEERERR